MSAIGKQVDACIRLSLAPLLKKTGFKKKGRTFLRTAQDLVHVVNVQASWTNSGDEGRFTVNLGVYFQGVERLLGNHVETEPRHVHCHIQERIGALLTPSHDHWWTIAPDLGLSEVAKSVGDAVANHGLPWLETVSTIDGATQSTRWMKNGAITLAALHVLAARQPEALQLMADQLKANPIAAPGWLNFARRVGWETECNVLIREARQARG